MLVLRLVENRFIHMFSNYVWASVSGFDTRTILLHLKTQFRGPTAYFDVQVFFSSSLSVNVFKHYFYIS